MSGSVGWIYASAEDFTYDSVETGGWPAEHPMYIHFTFEMSSGDSSAPANVTLDVASDVIFEKFEIMSSEGQLAKYPAPLIFQGETYDFTIGKDFNGTIENVVVSNEIKTWDETFALSGTSVTDWVFDGQTTITDKISYFIPYLKDQAQISRSLFDEYNFGEDILERADLSP